MVGGRTKVRSVPKQHRRVEALARALLKTKVDSSKRRRMHPCCRSRRNGRCGAEVFTLHLNSVVAAITFFAFSSHPRRGQRERYRCHTSSPLFVVATRQRIVARVWANSRAPRKYYLLYNTQRSTQITDPIFFYCVLARGEPQLAYAHAVQLLVDCFLLLTPFALFSEVGFWSIIATGVLTTFYQVRQKHNLCGGPGAKACP